MDIEKENQIENQIDISFILKSETRCLAWNYITKIVNSSEITEGFDGNNFLRHRIVIEKGVFSSIDKWYNDGIPELSLSYSSSGKLEGCQKSFYTNGHFRYVLYFKEGQFTGEQVRYNDKKEVIATFWYENGVLIPNKKEKISSTAGLAGVTGTTGVAGPVGPVGAAGPLAPVSINSTVENEQEKKKKEKEEKQDIYSDDNENIKLIFTALEENNFESFKFLLENTKNINIQATKNNNDFMYYLKNNQEKEYLLKQGFIPRAEFNHSIYKVLRETDLDLIKIYLEHVPKARTHDIDFYLFNWSEEKVKLFMEYGLIKDLVKIVPYKYKIAKKLGFKFDFDNESHLDAICYSNHFREIVYQSKKEEIAKLYQYMINKHSINRQRPSLISPKRLESIYKFDQVIFAIKTKEELDIRLKDLIQWKIGEYNYYGYETKNKTDFTFESKILEMYGKSQFHII